MSKEAKQWGLEMERLLRRIYHTEDTYADTVEREPYETLVYALARLVEICPQKSGVTQFVQEKHKGMGAKNAATLMNKGYDLKGVYTDLERAINELER